MLSGHSDVYKFAPKNSMLITKLYRDPGLERCSLECRNVIGFAINTPHDWLKKLAALLIQSEVKPTPIATRSHVFSRASCQLHVFCLVHWIVFVHVIYQRDYIGFDFTTVNCKPLYGRL